MIQGRFLTEIDTIPPPLPKVQWKDSDGLQIYIGNKMIV